MIFKVSDKFIEINYATDGLIENFGERDVEIAIVPKDPVINADGNIVLRQHNKLIYNLASDEKLFIRACGLSGAVDILPFEKSGVSDTYTKAEVNTLLNKKVNAETGKGLSTNDFTTALKDKLDGIDLSNYATNDELGNKVDKVSGKGLSSNDFTNALKTKLEGINLTEYQPKSAPSLKTTAKTIEEAINELFDEIQALKSTP